VSGVHLVVAEVALVLVALATAWSAVLLVGRRLPGRYFTVNLGWTVVAIACAALLGAGVLLTEGAPHDALHLLYGALALVALPLSAVLAARRPVGQRALVMTVGTVVLLILVLRLFQTGG
jgi:hypothetical protein